jgi:hypothetical protein
MPRLDQCDLLIDIKGSTYFVQILICQQRKAKLRAASYYPGRASLEQGFESFFLVWN